MATASDVLNDYKEFVKLMQQYSEERVKKAASDISNTTNSLYKSDGLDQNVRLAGNATKFIVSSDKNKSTAVVSANESKELIYLEFGTRNTNTEALTIRGGFESGIDAASIAAPYKVNYPFNKKDRIIGRYYFLDTIDKEGTEFVRNFMK